MHIRTSEHLQISSHVGCDVVMVSWTHQDNHPDMVINRAGLVLVGPAVFDQLTKTTK